MGNSTNSYRDTFEGTLDLCCWTPDLREERLSGDEVRTGDPSHFAPNPHKLNSDLTMTRSTPKILRLNGGKPLVQPVSDHQWESKVTFNPACVFVRRSPRLSRIIGQLPFSSRIRTKLIHEAGLCFLLYRAQGESTDEYDYSHSSIGLAILSPTLQLLARHTQPVIIPDTEYDNLGVEDGRITKVGNRFVMVYTAYSSGSPENRIRIAMASTTDFIHWEKHGLVEGNFNSIQNKNGMLFDRKIGDRYVMLHRPMEGKHAMSIHWAEADDPFGKWRSRGVLLEPIPDPAFVDVWIGGGAPPIFLKENKFLIIYHIGKRSRSGEREYDLGIAVVDFTRRPLIVKRNEPLLRPETAAETTPVADLGLANVLFVCGAYIFEGDLYLSYAGADSVVLGGKISKKELEMYITS